MKNFTVDRAQKCLPKVSKLMRCAQRLQEKIAQVMDASEPLLEVSNSEGYHFFLSNDVRSNMEFHRLYFSFYKCIHEVNALGALVRDVERGEVEFPCKISVHHGFLCWQLGEESIRFWRQVDSEEKKPLINLDEYL